MSSIVVDGEDMPAPKKPPFRGPKFGQYNTASDILNVGASAMRSGTQYARQFFANMIAQLTELSFAMGIVGAVLAGVSFVFKIISVFLNPHKTRANKALTLVEGLFNIASLIVACVLAALSIVNLPVLGFVLMGAGFLMQCLRAARSAYHTRSLAAYLHHREEKYAELERKLYHLYRERKTKSGLYEYLFQYLQKMQKEIEELRVELQAQQSQKQNDANGKFVHSELFKDKKYRSETKVFSSIFSGIAIAGIAIAAFVSPAGLGLFAVGFVAGLSLGCGLVIKNDFFKDFYDRSVDPDPQDSWLDRKIDSMLGSAHKTALDLEKKFAAKNMRLLGTMIAGVKVLVTFVAIAPLVVANQIAKFKNYLFPKKPDNQSQDEFDGSVKRMMTKIPKVKPVQKVEQVVACEAEKAPRLPRVRFYPTSEEMKLVRNNMQQYDGQVCVRRLFKI